MKKLYSVILGAMFLGFTACENVPAPYGVDWDGEGEDVEEIVVEPAGSGTLADPFNVAGIINYTSSLEADKNTTTKVYFKGYVTSFKSGEEPGNSYGNATYYIADTPKGTNTFYVFRGMYFGGKSFTSADQLKVGDEVLLCSNVVNFKGNTPETVQKECEVVAINGQGEGGGDTPTPTESSKEKPLTVAEAQVGSGEQYVKGFIVGYIDGKSLAEGATFKAASSATTNVLIADDAACTDYTQCVPVQLPQGKIRDFLTASKRENIGAEVLLYGSLESYFGTNGVKNVTWARMNQGEVGQDPEVEPVTDDYHWDFTKSQGQWTIVNEFLETGLERVWAQDTKYGMKASAFLNNKIYASKALLVSPKLDLTGKQALHIVHAGNKFASVDDMKKQICVLIEIPGHEAAVLPITTYPSNADWNFVDCVIDLGQYSGQKDATISFEYSSTATSAGTWEIQTVGIE